MLPSISPLFAQPVPPQDNAEFDKLFSDWTKAFNQKNLSAACGLFSTNLVAQYQGYPQKNYTVVCEGFKNVFRDTVKSYQYHYRLNQVYQSGNLAAARITWYLDVYEQNQRVSSSVDEGLDVLEKNAAGQWKIINYLSYPVALGSIAA
jgi:ketosteroid isomerase-like protein